MLRHTGTDCVHLTENGRLEHAGLIYVNASVALASPGQLAQHVLDARAQGQTLPRLAGVSDAALSPAEQSVEAERGLSGAAGPEY